MQYFDIFRLLVNQVGKCEKSDYHTCNVTLLYAHQCLRTTKDAQQSTSMLIVDMMAGERIVADEAEGGTLVWKHSLRAI